MNGEPIRAQRNEASAVQIEECCYRYWKIGGGMILGGLAMMLIAFLFPVAVMLIAAGATLIVANIVWFLRLRRQQGIMVSCPTCGKEYNVLPGEHTFMCDECKHVVPVAHGG